MSSVLVCHGNGQGMQQCGSAPDVVWDGAQHCTGCTAREELGFLNPRLSLVFYNTWVLYNNNNNTRFVEAVVL